jgi:hypothetical protein
MHAREKSGDPKRIERGGGTLRGDVLRARGSIRRGDRLSTLMGMPVLQSRHRRVRKQDTCEAGNVNSGDKRQLRQRTYRRPASTRISWSDQWKMIPPDQTGGRSGYDIRRRRNGYNEMIKHGYTPILRWQRGERVAMQQLSAATRSGIRPLIQLRPKQYVGRKATKTTPPMVAADAFAAEMKDCWGTAEFYMDASAMSQSGGAIHP